MVWDYISRGCKTCGREEIEKGCNGKGRIQGGIATVPGFGWWPIKAFRPCPGFVASGGRYRRQGQSMDEVAFGRGEREMSTKNINKPNSRYSLDTPIISLNFRICLICSLICHEKKKKQTAFFPVKFMYNLYIQFIIWLDLFWVILSRSSSVSIMLKNLKQIFDYIFFKWWTCWFMWNSK